MRPSILPNLLVAAGRNGEASAVYQAGLTLAEDFGVPVSGTLTAAGWKIGAAPVRPAAPAIRPAPASPPAQPSFVGRDEAWGFVRAGLGIAGAIASASPLPAAVAPQWIALGVGMGITVGVVAGVYPAARASRLDPVDALRYE